MKLSRRLLKISCSVLFLSITIGANANEINDPNNLLPKFIEHMSNYSFDHDFVAGDLAVGELKVCKATCFRDYYSRQVTEKNQEFAKVVTYDADGKKGDVEVIFREDYESKLLQKMKVEMDRSISGALKKMNKEWVVKKTNNPKTYVQLDAMLIVGSYASLNLSGKICDDSTGSCDSFLMNLNFSNAETYLTKLLDVNFQVGGYRLSNTIEKAK